MTDLSIVLFIVGIFFIIIVLPGTLFYFKKNHRNRGINQLKQLKHDSDFDVAHLIHGLNDSFLVAIDYDLAKVAYIEDDVHFMINFEDVLGAHVLSRSEVETLVSDRSFINQPALIGHNLLVHPKVVDNDKRNNSSHGELTVLLHISLNIKDIPDIYINCFDSRDHTVFPSKSKRLNYEQGVELAKKLESLFNYISKTVHTNSH